MVTEPPRAPTLRLGRRIAVVGAAVAAAVALVSAAGADAPAAAAPSLVRVWTIQYRAHDGLLRPAYVVLPRWYGPHDHPPIPLVISPHGRGVLPISNAHIWGDLPALGRFAVVNPEGQGRRLELYSWGDPGQIDDLAKMPELVHRALPWLRIDRRRVFAYGGSMGGQEVLLLVARHPGLLAGAAAFDAPANLALRYRDFRLLRQGSELQHLARAEVGGPPRTDPRAYAARSPLDFARQIAASGVSLQIWWSTRDEVVVDGQQQSGELYREILEAHPRAPVIQFVGEWQHTAEYSWNRRLPNALRFFHLLPPRFALPVQSLLA